MNFFATEPGPTALVTMPDIDPPYQRGICHGLFNLLTKPGRGLRVFCL
jgi:hypothetical protein